MKKVIVVHGWGGSPQDGWFPWLKEQLHDQKVEVVIPVMPNTEEPEMKAWVSELRNVASNLDEETVLIGHSIGCQTILRYLAELPEGAKVKKVILVAPWTRLNDETLEDEETMEIAGPWMNNPIPWDKVRNKAFEFVAIFSKEDYYVPLSEKEIFKDELDAEIIVLDGPGHLGGEDDMEEFPQLLETLS